MSTMISSFIAKSPASLPRRRSPLLTSPPRPLLRASQLTNGVCEQRFALLKVSCNLAGIKRAAVSEPETTSSWLSSAAVDENDSRCGAVRDSDVVSIKGFGFDKIQKMLGSQLSVASLVMIILTASYTVVGPVSSSLAMMELPYVEKEVVKESSPVAISLAKHLHSIGAKLYGAFWCSHCGHQKEILGREAVKLIDTIECYPDGVLEGTQMAQACVDVNLKYLPSWEINGELLDGTKSLEQLATLSGIKLEDLSQ